MYFRSVSLRRIGLLALCGLVGCGLQAYEQRLDATRQYYSYLDKIDQNLAAPWKEFPVDSLRVPNQFKLVPPPEGELLPDGTRKLPAVDPRQPDFLREPIDGLIGAWRADLDVVANNERLQRPGFLYVAANGSKFLEDKVDEAVNFTKTMLASLESSTQTAAKLEPTAMFPKGHQFVAKQTFDLALFNSPLNIHGARYTFEVYSTVQGDNQVVIIFAAPEGLDPMSKVAERIPLMLESMKISKDRPQRAQPGQPGQPGQPVGTSAPAAGGF